MSFIRRAYASLMTYEISDSEKDHAEKAIRWFNYALKKLEACDTHLDLIYTPLKQKDGITPDALFKIRASLRLYRDKVAENFNDFKTAAFKCYVMMQPFTSDTQTEKVLKSFVASIEDIETQVNRFIELFDNLKSEDFIEAIIPAIDHIKKEISELKQIVEDRMKGHIQSNILAKNWVDAVSNELQEKVEKKSPLVMQLVEERSEDEPANNSSS